MISIDTETTGTALYHGCQAFMVTTCDVKGKTHCWEWPVDPKTRKVQYNKKEVADLFCYLQGSLVWIFHYAGFDLQVLRLMCQTRGQEKAVDFAIKDTERTEDTLHMSHVYNSRLSHSLKDLALLHCGIPDDDAKGLRARIVKAHAQIRRIPNWERKFKISPNVMWDMWLLKCLDPTDKTIEDYGIRDAVRTMMVYKQFTKNFTPQHWQHYETHKQFRPVITALEEAGIPTKPTVLKTSVETNRHQLIKLEKPLKRIAKPFGFPDFNIRSTKQVGELLYDYFGLPIFKLTGTQKGSTDKDTIQELIYQYEDIPERNNQYLKFLLGFQKYKTEETKRKYLTDYQSKQIKHGPGNWRVHSSFNQTGTATTRLSSSEPNAQNVGKNSEVQLRHVFGPIRGTFWYDIDYSQLELRILAVAANETKMLEAFQAGADIHQWTADLCGIERGPAKNANFAAVYGAGKAKLAAMTGIPNMGELFKQAYPGVVKFSWKTIAQAESSGVVETLGGYPLQVDPHMAYSAIDYVIQGTAGEIVRFAMIDLYHLLPRKYPGVRMIINIHDELIFEVPNKYTKDKTLPRFLKKVMEAAGDKVGVTTPVDVSRINKNWAEPKEISL